VARFVLACIILALAWTGGLIGFAADMSRMTVQDDDPVDAIVVLTGGSERLEAGLDLLARQKGKKLFVSGVYRGVEVSALLKLSRQSPDAVECCIKLGYTADNTQGNAAETAAWMKSEGLHSLLLVTANYHMRRSLAEFRAALPGHLILPHPVAPERVKAEEWWRWPGTLSLIASEYTKYVVAETRLFLEKGEVF
jgi:uncharacterized SAM-binding protein YcdF (DUF218 family)